MVVNRKYGEPDVQTVFLHFVLSAYKPMLEQPERSMACHFLLTEDAP